MVLGPAYIFGHENRKHFGHENPSPYLVLAKTGYMLQPIFPIHVVEKLHKQVLNYWPTLPKGDVQSSQLWDIYNASPRFAIYPLIDHKNKW